jgi:outer membrane protein
VNLKETDKGSVYMKSTLVGIVALLVAMGAVALHFLQRAPKIGYAETSVLMAEFTEAIKAKQEFEVAQKEWDKNLKTINDSLMAAMAKMKAGYEKATPQERHVMSEGLEKWNDNLRKYTNAVKSMSQERERLLMEPVLNKLNSYLKIWGADHGYDMIFGALTGGNILQANDAFNVTTKLLIDLNLHYKDLPQAVAKMDSSISQNKMSMDSSKFNGISK